MEIEIQGTSGTPRVNFRLSADDSTEEDRLSELVINGQRSTQIADGIGWTDVDVYDRGNRQTEITFNVTKLHASVNDAEIYIAEHEGNIPGRGNVFLTFSNRSIKRWLENAVISVVQSRLRGSTTFHSYQIIGGRIRSK